MGSVMHSHSSEWEVWFCFIFKFCSSLQDAYFSLQCFPLLECYCMHAAFYSERAKISVGESNILRRKSSGRKSTSLKRLPWCIVYPFPLHTSIHRGILILLPDLSWQLFQNLIVLVLYLLFNKLPHNAFMGADFHLAWIIIKCLFIVISQDLIPCA